MLAVARLHIDFEEEQLRIRNAKVVGSTPIIGTIIYATSRDVQQKCLVPYFCHFLPEMSQFDRVLKKRMELKWVYLHCHFLLQ